MKYLIPLITICLLSFKSNGQKIQYQIIPDNTIKYFDIIVFGSHGFNAQLAIGSDTLEITATGRVKFIKIGERIYKIESPTLVEVKNESPVIWWYNREKKYVTTDSLLNIDKYYFAEPYRKPNFQIKQP